MRVRLAEDLIRGTRYRVIVEAGEYDLVRMVNGKALVNVGLREYRSLTLIPVNLLEFINE